MSKTKTPARKKLSPEGTKLKSKWLRALRSGKYNQGTGALCYRVSGTDEKSYCCLGVLCDVLDPTAWKGTNDLGFKRPQTAIYPPKSVLSLVGLTARSAIKLAELNDDHRLSFEEIADKIKSGNLDPD